MCHQKKTIKLPVTCEMIGEMLLLSPLKGKNLLNAPFLSFWKMFLFREAAPKTTTWVCLKIVYPIVPNGFADHYPYEKWLFHWEY